MPPKVLPELPYRIHDADNHFNEPLDLYERYIDPAQRDKAIIGGSFGTYAGRPSKMAQAHKRKIAKDDVAAIAERLVPTAADEEQVKSGDGAPRMPGMLLSRLNPYKGLDEQERLALIAEFREQEESFGNRDVRLALMDDQGIDAALMFPATVLNLEFELADDVDAIVANVRAFNRWIYEEPGFAHLDRMFMPPYISLADVDAAVQEVETVIAQGAPIVQIMAGHAHGGRDNPRGGRSIADPIYDPVWARLNEAGTRVAIHLGATDYQKYGADWSEDPDAVLGNFDALQWVLFWGDRPAMETVAAMIMHNLFGRFPNLRVCLSEQGTVWLPYILRKLDHAHAMGRPAKWGKLDRRPKEIFRQHFVVAPFPEENVERVVAEVGIEPIVFGSDFPHGEGLAYPREYAWTQLKNFTDDDVHAIMRGNMDRFLGLDA